MEKDELTELSVSLAKSVFSVIPFAGGVLNEVAFDYRSRLKQERLNKFIGLLSDFFSGNPDIAPENLKTEEFSDLFESVVRRVLLTKSLDKQRLFRNVLADHILNPAKNTESAEVYLDLIGSLDEMAINILKAHLVYLKFYENTYPAEKELHDTLSTQGQLINELKLNEEINKNQLAELKQEYVENQRKYEDIKALLLGHQGFRDANYFNLTNDEYLYYKQILYAKGLLVDKGLGMHNGGKTFLYMWVTEYGKRFLEFINHSDQIPYEPGARE